MSAGFEPGYRGGGPIRSVTALVDEYSGPGHVLVVTRDRDLGVAEPYDGLSGETVRRSERVSVFYGSMRNATHWFRLGRLLFRQQFEVLYLNSFFSPTFSLMPLLAAKVGILRPKRVLVSPRGELMRGARGIKPRKKRLVIAVWRKLLSKGVTLHATSEIERQHIAEIFPRAQVLVIAPPPPQVTSPPTEASTNPVLRACYVGRVSAKKNLMNTLEGLSHLREPIQFDIYGPIEDHGHWARCTEVISRMPATAAVKYRGELTHDQVHDVFASHDVFVFPTLGENYGHVVAESLSSSCPVVLGHDTPWSDVIRDGGGWLVDARDASAITRTLRTLALMTPQERTLKKQTARQAYMRYCAMSSRHSVLNVFESQSGGDS